MKDFVLHSFLAFCFFALGGCGSLTTPKPDPTRFYVLASLDKSVQTPDAIYCKGIHLGVGRVDLPGYLDTQKMVKFGLNHEVVISEFNRWAEPLPAGFERVLTANIALLTGIESIETFPWVNPRTHDFEIYTEVQSFQADADNVVRLDVFWRITSARGKQVLYVETSSYSQLSDGSYPGIVAAMSAVVGQYSESVSQALVQAARMHLEHLKQELIAQEEIKADDPVITRFEETVGVSPRPMEPSEGPTSPASN